MYGLYSYGIQAVISRACAKLEKHDQN
jgi:hypothetical protein